MPANSVTIFLPADFDALMRKIANAEPAEPIDAEDRRRFVCGALAAYLSLLGGPMLSAEFNKINQTGPLAES